MIKIEVDDTKARLHLDGMPSRVHDELLRAVRTQAFALEGFIKANELSGQVLHVRSGNLRASIHNEIVDDSATVEGRVYSDGTVKYARIHEYGGDIYPTAAKALRFVIDGKVILAKHVHMPERSFMRRGLSENKDQIVAALTAAVGRGTAAP